MSVVADRRGTTTDGKTEITDAMKLRNTKLVKLASSIFDLHGNIPGEPGKIINAINAMLLSHVVEYCHRAMNMKAGDTNEVMRGWKQHLLELGYTENKLKKIDDNFTPSRSEIYVALNNLGKENGMIYPIDEELSLQWLNHGTKPAIKVVNRAGMLTNDKEGDFGQ